MLELDLQLATSSTTERHIFTLKMPSAFSSPSGSDPSAQQPLIFRCSRALVLHELQIIVSNVGAGDPKSWLLC